jgi:hypothetical protein
MKESEKRRKKKHYEGVTVAGRLINKSFQDQGIRSRLREEMGFSEEEIAKIIHDARRVIEESRKPAPEPKKVVPEKRAPVPPGYVPYSEIYVPDSGRVRLIERKEKPPEKKNAEERHVAPAKIISGAVSASEQRKILYAREKEDQLVAAREKAFTLWRKGFDEKRIASMLNDLKLGEEELRGIISDARSRSVQLDYDAASFLRDKKSIDSTYTSNALEKLWGGIHPEEIRRSLVRKFNISDIEAQAAVKTAMVIMVLRMEEKRR